MKVIGIGNETRGDDAVGRIVAAGIRDRNLPGVQVQILRGEGASLMEAWKGEAHVVVIDCAFSGADPGAVHHFQVDMRPLPVRLVSTSTHAFGVAEAIELARALGELPPHIEVYAIEGSAFSPGSAVAPEVLGAAQTVIQEIVQRATHP